MSEVVSFTGGELSEPHALLNFQFLPVPAAASSSLGAGIFVLRTSHGLAGLLVVACGKAWKHWGEGRFRNARDYQY